MLISFTGTQQGMTKIQRENIDRWLTLRALNANSNTGFHGCCVGGDDEFDSIIAKLGFKRVGFPSNLYGKRVPNEVLQARGPIVIAEPDSPLRRNRLVVRQGAILLAAPAQMAEVLRSGTWATIRYAEKVKRPIVMFMPDGSIIHVNESSRF